MRGGRPQGVGGARARPSEGTWARGGTQAQIRPASPEAERTPRSAKAATPPRPRVGALAAPSRAPAHSPTCTPGRPQQPRRRQEEVRTPHKHVPGGRSSLILGEASWWGEVPGSWSVRDVTDPLGGTSRLFTLGRFLPGQGPWGGQPRGRLLLQPVPASEPPPGPAP